MPLGKCMAKMILIMILVGVVACAMAAACPVTLTATSTDQLFDGLAVLDEQLKICNVTLPAEYSLLLKDGFFLVGVEQRAFLVEIADSRVIGAREDGTVPKGFVVQTSACVMDSVLASDNRMGTFAYFYTQGQVRINGVGMWGKAKLLVLKPFLSSAFKKIMVEPEALC